MSIVVPEEEVQGAPASTGAADAALAPPAIDAAPLGAAEAVERWDQLCRQMAQLLREADPGTTWLAQFNAVALACRELAQRDVDAALYLLLQASAAEGGRYSACHAMLCALICELCAAGLGWPDTEVDSVSHAAMTMNLSMTELQDALVTQTAPLTPAQREAIDTHAERSALLLAASGVDDALWLDVVRRHHAEGSATDASPDAAARLAELLHRVDRYTAKLSSRVGREPTSPAIAARDTCLDAQGKPDRVGGVLLRALGLYPPGCFVQVANGDFGIVVKRGAKAHMPWVAALRRQDGSMYNLPTRRQTGSREHAVRHGVTRSAVNVLCDHVRILGAV